MRRAFVLGGLLALGGLVAVKAQPPAADAPKVIEVEKVKDNLYVLRGGGGNTAVFLTANGVTVVDAKNPGWGKPILDKIKELTPKPVTLLINTHTHGDHVSGNSSSRRRSTSSRRRTPRPTWRRCRSSRSTTTSAWPSGRSRIG